MKLTSILRLTVSAVICFLLAGSTGPKLVKTKLAEGLIVRLPKTFRPMDELDLTQRYPSVRQPIAGFTNEERDVAFSVNVSATQWPDQNIDLAQKFFKSGLYNMFDGVDMISEGVREVHGKSYIYFEFESRVKGDRMKLELQDPVLTYTYIQYLVEPGRTLVFSFNCPRRMRADWQPTAHAVMNSIRLK